MGYVYGWWVAQNKDVDQSNMGKVNSGIENFHKNKRRFYGYLYEIWTTKRNKICNLILSYIHQKVGSDDNTCK